MSSIRAFFNRCSAVAMAVALAGCSTVAELSDSDRQAHLQAYSSAKRCFAAWSLLRDQRARQGHGEDVPWTARSSDTNLAEGIRLGHLLGISRRNVTGEFELYRTSLRQDHSRYARDMVFCATGQEGRD